MSGRGNLKSIFENGCVIVTVPQPFCHRSATVAATVPQPLPQPFSPQEALQAAFWGWVARWPSGQTRAILGLPVGDCAGRHNIVQEA